MSTSQKTESFFLALFQEHRRTGFWIGSRVVELLLEHFPALARHRRVVHWMLLDVPRLPTEDEVLDFIACYSPMDEDTVRKGWRSSCARMEQ